MERWTSLQADKNRRKPITNKETAIKKCDEKWRELVHRAAKNVMQSVHPIQLALKPLQTWNFAGDERGGIIIFLLSFCVTHERASALSA
jgi:hypothetical protein